MFQDFWNSIYYLLYFFHSLNVWHFIPLENIPIYQHPITEEVESLPDVCEKSYSQEDRDGQL